jgi:alpha-methylacyl-CoA racemase
MAKEDICFAPVLDWNEAPHHPHNKARQVFIEIDGVTQPAPAPRFSRTPASVPRPPAKPGADTDAVLLDWGWSEKAVNELYVAGLLSKAEQPQQNRTYK